jgi:hypothetical protein
VTQEMVPLTSVLEHCFQLRPLGIFAGRRILEDLVKLQPLKLAFCRLSLRRDSPIPDPLPVHVHSP